MDIYYDIYNHVLFRDLSDSTVQSLASLFKEYRCDEGAVLYYNRDGGGALFLFMEGEFCASTADGGNRKYYFSGDFTDLRNLTSDEQRHDTLICRNSGRYLKVEREDFIEFSGKLKRREIRDLYRTLGISSEENSTISRSEEGERTIYQWRKSGYYLLRQLKYPLLILAGLLFVSTRSFSFPGELLFFQSASLILILFSSVKVYLWFREKYYLNGRNLSSVVFRFKPFGLGRKVLPLDQIRGLRVEKKKLRNRFFNVGSLHVQTSAGTVLVLEDLDHPTDVEKRISEFLKQSDKKFQTREKQEIRKKVEEYFEVEEDIHPSAPEKVENRKGPERVIFRKSVAFLIAGVWWQILFFAVLVCLSWLFRDSGGAFLLVAALPLIAIFVWRVQDWRNDLYMVSGGKITDINRKPFGKSESSNLTDMEYVTDISSEKNGLFQYLFNFGDVIIETAGGSIRFETVADPLGVQSRLLELREAWKQDEEKKRRDRQFQDFLVYSEIYKQAEEQNRLNRLTPPRSGSVEQGV